MDSYLLEIWSFTGRLSGFFLAILRESLELWPLASALRLRQHQMLNSNVLTEQLGCSVWEQSTGALRPERWADSSILVSTGVLGLFERVFFQ